MNDPVVTGLSVIRAERPIMTELSPQVKGQQLVQRLIDRGQILPTSVLFNSNSVISLGPSKHSPTQSFVIMIEIGFV
jgi:hypothetical protein